ncbi:MAG: hypothetical protein ACE5IZ_00055 [Dehalococcoidia bacterium]
MRSEVHEDILERLEALERSRASSEQALADGRCQRKRPLRQILLELNGCGVVTTAG